MTVIMEFPDRRAVADEAAEWLIRLDADTPPTREELLALREWLRRSPLHRAELESLAQLWGRMNVLTDLAVPLGISSGAAARAERMGPRWGRKALVAAGLAVIVAIGAALLEQSGARNPLLATNGWYATAVGEQRTEVLADGSRVVLNTNSRIRVDYDDGHRNVHLLQGEALFEVAKHAQRPFRVYAGTGRIEALGTAFSVHLDGADVSVTVTEGRVALASMNPPQWSSARTASGAPPREASVAAPGPGDVVETLGTLEAGHVAKIRSSPPMTAVGASVLESIEPVAAAELAQRLAWRDGALMFSGETLEEVVNEFARYTSVSIEIPDATVRNIRIGGRFPAGDTETLLATLETSFNLRVTRLGHDRVSISAGEDQAALQ